MGQGEERELQKGRQHKMRSGHPQGRSGTEVKGPEQRGAQFPSQASTPPPLGGEPGSKVNEIHILCLSPACTIPVSRAIEIVYAIGSNKRHNEFKSRAKRGGGERPAVGPKAGGCLGLGKCRRNGDQKESERRVGEREREVGRVEQKKRDSETEV